MLIYFRTLPQTIAEMAHTPPFLPSSHPPRTHLNPPPPPAPPSLNASSSFTVLLRWQGDTTVHARGSSRPEHSNRTQIALEAVGSSAHLSRAARLCQRVAKVGLIRPCPLFPRCAGACVCVCVRVCLCVRYRCPISWPVLYREKSCVGPCAYAAEG